MTDPADVKSKPVQNRTAEKNLTAAYPLWMNRVKCRLEYRGGLVVVEDHEGAALNLSKSEGRMPPYTLGAKWLGRNSQSPIRARSFASPGLLIWPSRGLTNWGSVGAAMRAYYGRIVTRSGR
jgi:hypothetical protein